MTEYCRNCGEKLKENASYCVNCGAEVPKGHKYFSKKYAILIIIVIIALAIFLSSSLFFNSTQLIKVDNVQFEIPSDYVSEPSRTDVNFDGNVKSSAMGWSNDENYIEIGVTRTPGSGINSKEVASSIGGTPSKMFGYSGYYLEYEDEGYAFVFGLKDEVCMVYVSNYDAFKDINVIGIV